MLGLNHLTQWLITWLNYSAPSDEVPLCDFTRIRQELKPGDVLLLEGRSRISNVIRMVTSSPWTHAALYIGRLHDIEDPILRTALLQHFPCEPDAQLLIESLLGYGTIVQPLTYYQRDHLRICRPQGLSYTDAQDVTRYAISRLGAEYDIKQIVDLARFFLPWSLLPKRWRSSVFQQSPGRSTRTVCSTMIAEAFGFIQFPILPLVKRVDKNEFHLYRRNPKLCVPRDFDFSPYFNIIKYPFIDYQLHNDQRLLPWKQTPTTPDDAAKMCLIPSTHPVVSAQNL